MEEKIIELVFMPWESLPDKLKKLGLKAQLEEHGETLLIGNENFGTGLTRNTDPINTAVIIAWVLCGPEWMVFFPELLRKVELKWKKIRQGRQH